MGDFMGSAFAPLLVAAWVVAGLVAAYLAWHGTGGGRMRLLGAVVAGLLGAMAGGIVAVALVQDGTAVPGSIALAFVGSWTFVLIARSTTTRRA